MIRVHKVAFATIFTAAVVALSFLVFGVYKENPTPVTAQVPEEVRASIIAEPPLSEYIEVSEGCGPYFEGTCVNMRSGPGEEYPVVLKLRTGMVLGVASTTTINGSEWYKVKFDSWLWYPERMVGDYFVSADVVRLFSDHGDRNFEEGMTASSTKRITVDRSEQKLYAYDGDTLFMEEPISTGLELTPTPRGVFTVYKKTPSRYMQGPLPGISDQYYDLPGVPWNLYFTPEGGAIHGAYWHDKFGQPWSHGCVNQSPDQAKKLYEWADVGTKVLVRD